MVLDECTPFPATEPEAEKSMMLSMRWAQRSKIAFGEQPGHVCFGIVQGGVYPALRQRSADMLKDISFDGYAIGGLAVGEGHQLMLAMLDVTVTHLPEDRPRYLMGVGKPIDLVEAVTRGIDMFDCVLPTRSGRNGQAFTRQGTINIRNARHVEDSGPLDAACSCPACRQYSRAYLHHLVKAEEILGAMLITWHNLQYYQDLMGDLRTAIAQGRVAQFAHDFRVASAAGNAGDEPGLSS
jgi:queuine tRNA-ribosyltransferase